MRNIKILFIVFSISMFLAFGTPAVSSAAQLQQMPPATVFTIDMQNPMLLKHNFNGDDKIYIPGKTDADPGFYVQIP